MPDAQANIGQGERTGPARLRGNLDVASRDWIKGWAFEPDNPGERVPLAVLANGCIVCRVSADTRRTDLEKAGIGDGHYGFVMRLSELLDPGVSYEIKVVREADGAELNGSPKLLLPAERRRTTKPQVRQFQEIFPIGRSYDEQGRGGLLRDLARVHAAVGNTDEARRLLELAQAESPEVKFLSELLANLE